MTDFDDLELDLSSLDIDELDYDLSLKAFTMRAWQELEPGTPMTDGWALDAVCAHLEAVTRGEITRLVINIPPGCSKSMLTNVFWPAWEWRQRPWLRYISASYEQGLAVRDLVRCRDLILSEWYQSRWPMAFKDDFNLKTIYVNNSTGFRFASSVGGALTGYRGDRIIMDDPHSTKTAESDIHRAEALRWGTETVPTRLNESKRAPSAIVLIMQRLHEEDLSGLFLESDSWTHLCLPMEWENEHRSKTTVHWTSDHLGITEPEPFMDPRGHCPSRIPDVEGETRADAEELLWPERFGRESVDRLKIAFRSMGDEYAVAGQLQQRPAPREGGIFQIDKFRFVDSAPEGGVECRGWDLASTSRKKNKRAAFTAGVRLRVVDGTVYIIDVVREQFDPADVDELLVATASFDGLSVPISLPLDPGQAGVHQKRHITSLLHGHIVHWSAESGEKEHRAYPIASQVRAGNVCIVRGDWNRAFMNEAANFPGSTFKDQIDALSRAYSYLVNTADPEVDVVGGMLLT